jgi:repressor LexA
MQNVLIILEQKFFKKMTTEYLHPIQQKLLDLLAENSDEPLTIREFQTAVGATSTSVVSHHIAQLEKKGYIKKNPYNPRDFQILKTPDKEVAYLNLYGLAACGPEGSVLDGDPLERIAVSTKFIPFSSDQAFMVKAKGNSMLPKINSGDYVIAKKADKANDGEVIVCVNKGEALIKKIKIEKSGKGIILVSFNNDFEPFLAAKDFRIEGIVKGIITNKTLSF